MAFVSSFLFFLFFPPRDELSLSSSFDFSVAKLTEAQIIHKRAASLGAKNEKSRESGSDFGKYDIFEVEDEIADVAGGWWWWVKEKEKWVPAVMRCFDRKTNSED